MRKTQTSPVLILLAAFSVLPVSAQVIQEKIVTIGPGETIVTDESCLQADSGAAGDFFVVTRATVGGKTTFFTYDKNGKKGPFDKILPSMLRDCAKAKREPAYYESPGSMDGIGEGGGRGIITFQGKSYGPFQQILNLQVTPDKSRFYALAAKGGALRFISSDGRDVPAAGMPVDIRVSPDGTKAVATCLGAVTIIDGVQVDMSKINPETFNDTYLYTIDGAKLGPFRQDQDFGGVWFASGSQNWLFALGKAIYLNGKLLRTFPQHVDKGTFWLDDEKRYAWIDGTDLSFSDGEKFSFPVMIRNFKRGGKTVLRWIGLQKNGDVVAFQRTL